MDVGAIVFDMDGVLIDSESVWEDVRRTLVGERGGRWQPDSQHRMMGMSTREWARYLTGEVGLPMTPDEAAREVIDRMVERFSTAPPLLPGAVEAVRRLADRWPLGLASSSARRLIDVVLDRAGLGGCFAVTLSTEEVERGKPAPDVYLEATRRLGAGPGRCVAIEDSTNGLRSAHAAGLSVIAIPRPDFPPAPDALTLAAVVLDRIEELTEDVVTAAARAA